MPGGEGHPIRLAVTRGVALAVATAALVVAACGGGGSLRSLSDTSTTSGPRPTTADPTFTTETAPTLTEQQVASVVAQDAPAIREAIAKYETDCLLGIGCDDELIDGLNLTTLHYSAATLGLDLGTIDDPTKPGYQGEIPPTLRTLVDQTKAATEEMNVRANEYTACSTSQPSSECLTFDLDHAVRNLATALDGWQPYL